MQTIQHIALADEWDEAQREGTYATSTLGMSIDAVGYMHASFPEQVRPTIKRFYSDVDAPLVLLTLDPDALTEAGLEVRVEPRHPTIPRASASRTCTAGRCPSARSARSSSSTCRARRCEQQQDKTKAPQQMLRGLRALWCQVKDSNLRSFRDGFTVRSHWPLGQPGSRARKP